MRLDALFAACLGLTLFAGCVGETKENLESVPDATAVPFTFATDVAGDAVYRSSAGAQQAVARCMGLPSALRSPCAPAASALRDDVPHVGGVPAPASLDVLGGTLNETPGSLVATIQVHSLSEGFAEFLEPDGSTWALWDVCWVVDADKEMGWECAYLVARASNGVAGLEAFYDRYTSDCNDWWWCSWHVEAQVTYGSPATITFTIPRFILGAGAAGDGLGEPAVASTYCTQLAPRTHWGAQGAFEDGGMVFGTGCETSDQSEGGLPFTFATEATATDATKHPLAPLADPVGDAAGRADADVLSLQIVETPEFLTAVVELAQVDAQPQDLTTDFAIGLPSGRVYEAGYDIRDGVVEPWGGYCDDADCDEWIEFTPEVELVPGTPGWAKVSIDRTTLGSPAAGDLLNLAYFAILPVTHAGTSVPVGLGASVTQYEGGDWSQTMPPQFLALDTA